MKSKLYLVSTPIGNYEDITLRALKILKDADIIICEEFKEAKRLLAQYQVQKELHALNEHNEEESSRELFNLIAEGKTAALISDCGTPLFSDPGTMLVQMCIDAGIDVVPVPGASSLMAALTGAGFKLDRFYYAGWLSPKGDIRKRELSRLKGISELIVLMETPYRLKAILTDISKTFPQSIQIAAAYNLTQSSEKFYRGTASEVLKIVTEKNLKGEYVLIIDNRKTRR